MKYLSLTKHDNIDNNYMLIKTWVSFAPLARVMSSEVSQLVLQVQPEDVRGRRRHQPDSLPGSDTIHGNVM